MMRLGLSRWLTYLRWVRGRCEMLELILLRVCGSLGDLWAAAAAVAVCGYTLGQDDVGERFGMAAPVRRTAGGFEQV